MSEGFNIKKMSGKALEIAKMIDAKNVTDGKISGKEISIFYKECRENGVNMFPDFVKENYVAPNDAIRVKQPIILEPQLVNKKTPSKQPVVNPKPLGPNSDLRTNYEWSVEEFGEVLDKLLNNPKYKGKFKHSVLQNKEEAFVKAGKEFNIDPRMLVAIAMHESTRGISYKAQKLNNIGGLRINGEYHHFESVDESIRSIAKTLASRYSEGFKTPREVAYSGRYCEKRVAPTWLANIDFYLDFYDKNYNK